jgi:hypothetical protein
MIKPRRRLLMNEYSQSPLFSSPKREQGRHQNPCWRFGLNRFASTGRNRPTKDILQPNAAGVHGRSQFSGSPKARPSGFCIYHDPVQPFDLQGTRRRQGIRPGVTGSKSDIGSTVGEQNEPDRLARLSPPLATSQPMGLPQCKRERRCAPHG